MSGGKYGGNIEPLVRTVLIVADNFDDFLVCVNNFERSHRREDSLYMETRYFGIRRIAQVRDSESWDFVVRTDEGDFDVWRKQVLNNKREPVLPAKPAYNDDEFLPTSIECETKWNQLKIFFKKYLQVWNRYLIFVPSYKIRNEQVLL